MELGNREYASRLFKKAGVALFLGLGSPRIEKKTIEQYLNSWNSEDCRKRGDGGGAGGGVGGEEKEKEGGEGGLEEVEDYFSLTD